MIIGVLDRPRQISLGRKQSRWPGTTHSNIAGTPNPYFSVQYFRIRKIPQALTISFPFRFNLETRPESP